jgi:hypothetical protein
MKKSSVVLAALALSAVASLPVLAQPSAEVPVQVTALNNGFRTAYAQAKRDILARVGPVIVAVGNDVVLVDGDKRDVQNTIAPEYTLLKTVDHIPLALFVLLDKRVDKPLPEDVLQALRNLNQLTAAALPDVAASSLPDATKARLKDMLERSTAFANAAIEKGATRAQLDRFVADVRQSTMDNVYDATAMELAALDAQVQKWRAQMPPERWEDLRAVVVSGHMPRERERRMQYFGALLGEKREGERLIFMENANTVDAALDLLATHILDESIAREYFKDKWRMHRDLLSDAAAKYLRSHPPGKTKVVPVGK